MNRMSKWLLLFVTVILLFSLSGCTAIGIDVENQMHPPKNNGEQELLQEALDTYISQNNITQYSLKYPSGGNYLSAFILLSDLQPPTYVSTSTQETVTHYTGAEDFCIAFYQPDMEGANTHIHLLRNIEGEWVSVSDIEGRGSTLAQVDFADLDGDSFPELLIGWNLYNTKDRILYVYSINNTLKELSTTEIYTSMVVSDLTADGADDLLLLTIDPITDLLSANLFSYRSQKLSVVGWTVVDTDVLSIGDSLMSIFADNTRGVFVDVYKEPNATVTQLLIWKDEFLQSPFYSSSEPTNSLTARPFLLNCRDVDEDGIVEWPVVSDLQDDNLTATNVCWETQWYYYDIIRNKILFDFDSVVNTNDGYVLKLTDAFPKEFTVVYDEENHIADFVATDKNGDAESSSRSFLKIQTTTSNKKTELPDGFTFFDSSDSLYFSVWYSEELTVTMEEIRYLFSLI